MKPLNQNVIIKSAPLQLQPQTGLFIPDTAKQDQSIATVIAIGTGYPNGKSLSVKVGDKVVYSKYAVQSLNYEDQEYLILSEFDILAIIED
jgi:chaperonin GroES